MPPKPVASIDLHGYRKEQAIASVTQFLESVVREQQHASFGELWVCIITGSGHHSHAGPVLREAVRSLLDKREMEYSIPYGKGSFLVNACSGHELTASPATATDSKLVVKPSMTNDVRLVNRPRNTRMAASRTTNSVRVAAAASLPAPLPSEVAADDKLVEKVKTESEHHHRQTLKHENKLLKQAMTASKRELEREELEEEERLAAVLRESQQEEERLQQEEKERLDEILRHSREEEERIRDEEQEKLAAVLKQSEQEEERQRMGEEELLKRALSVSQVGVSEDDKALHEALEQSMHEVNAANSELNKALSLSLRETVPDEDELLEKALRLSITESTMPEFVEQVDYIIEEVD